jgi:hypothetical protein
VSEGVRRWERGRGVVDDLVERRELQRVPADDEAGRRMLDAARTRLTSTAMIRDVDPVMALAVACDAARRALAALLETQGCVPQARVATARCATQCSRNSTGCRVRSRCARSIGCADVDTPSSTWTRKSSRRSNRGARTGEPDRRLRRAAHQTATTVGTVTQSRRPDRRSRPPHAPHAPHDLDGR